jgi:uncharacterized membrane protein YbhN (UPF0104 family)
MRAPSGTRTEVPARPSAADVEPRRIDRVLGLLRIGCGVLLFVLVVVATVRNWMQVRATLSLIEPHELVLAESLVLAGLGLSVLTWRRCLDELGSWVRLEAASRIYLLGQLGKYVPGSVWALALQTELAKGAGVPRTRGVAASVVAIGVNVAIGLALGAALVLTRSDGGVWQSGSLLIVATGCAIALSPRVLTGSVNACLRLIRRPPLSQEVTWRGISSATGWSLASWISYGLSVWVIAVAVGAPAGTALAVCVTGVPLAMTAGFLAVIAPSGIGVREAVLVWSLAPVLERSDALAVALVARLLFTIGDLLAAVVVAQMRLRPSGAM